MMHCGRRLLPSGIRLLCGGQQRLLSASSHVIKSSLPDVEIPSTAVPDYVWQRVDQWPDKVATVSMHRASRVLRVISGSRRLAYCTHCQRSQVHRRTLMQGCFLRTHKNRTLGAQKNYGKVMSQCGDRTCLTAVKQSVHGEI